MARFLSRRIMMTSRKRRERTKSIGARDKTEQKVPSLFGLSQPRSLATSTTCGAFFGYHILTQLLNSIDDYGQPLAVTLNNLTY